MRLRAQLAILALVTLALPWAGCQYVQQMEQVLRKGQEATVLASARILGESLGDPRYFYPDQNYLDEGGVADSYAYPLLTPMSIDGYKDDWSSRVATRTFTAKNDNGSTFEARVKIGVKRQPPVADKGLYIYLSVKADRVHYVVPKVNYTDPVAGFANARRAALFTADSFWLQLEQADGSPLHLVIQTAAPGKVKAKRLRFEKGRAPVSNYSAIAGQWQDTPDGYNLELHLPLKQFGQRFAFGVIHPDQDQLQVIGTALQERLSPRKLVSAIARMQQPAGYLIEPSLSLQQKLPKLALEDSRFLLTDRYQWVLAQQGQLSDLIVPAYDSAEGIMAILYRWILDDNTRRLQLIGQDPGRINVPEIESALAGETSVGWYRFADNRAVVMAAYPVRDKDQIVGAVVVQKGTGDILLLASEAWGGLVRVSLLVTVVVLLVLVGFAALLSWRIRRLSREAESVINEDGRLADVFHGSRATDEIGELSRSFSRLHLRASQYTQYLQGLSSKLAHELRTPLAVIRTSLENLPVDAANPESAEYRDRALSGADRLRSIIDAMSEARRVEQAIANAENERFVLDKVIAGMVSAYADVYPKHRFQFRPPVTSLPLQGDPDLVVQLLDKLVDNATGFAPEDSTIEVGLEQQGANYVLSVANRGPLLPDAMQQQLFDSMVSMRPSNDGRHHLGFGLYIVRLIAESFRGRVEAKNMPSGEGVVFRVFLSAPANQ
ncbi:ATP-binding protein [Aestuariirhabdus sp. Z084]|uniref:ATP-binding protein n=1 Tax=Aestuariirhabdus haliotis TaxID=2918751 RepID=UPI00201B3710|nr:ATP-binding protein [Aestuariirhabdus haliotis]MCL6415264.1 ATP-binding protein [Aestuariirhabdus haliotis]MCL6419524.1 ATP-binding protein [Aestuariirhabdus haliotis]